MLIKTINELRACLPGHQFANIENLLGFLKNSEQDFLRDRLGTPLLTHLCRYYDSLPIDASVTSYDDPAELGIDVNNPWFVLLDHAQHCIVYNAAERYADSVAISLNNSGANLISADGYDTARKEDREAFKRRMWQEAYKSVDRMIVFLEELSGSHGAEPEEVAEGEPTVDYTEDKAKIVELWRKSRYYGLVDGLLINTATRMQDFISLEDMQERFIHMLPDMRFIQRNYLRTEVGDALFDRLLNAVRDGSELKPEEEEIIYQLRELLALYTQERSRVFKFTIEERKRIEEECIGLKRELLKLLAAYREKYNDDGTDKEPPTPAAPDDNAPEQEGCCGCCGSGAAGANGSSQGGPAPLNDRYWGDKGSVFVMPGVI